MPDENNTPPLTGRQKRHLRSLGQQLPAAVQLGKAGPSPAVLEQIHARLQKNELLKVRLGFEQGAQRKPAAEALARAAGCALAGLVGRTALLYRPNPLLPDDQRTVLPR